MPANALNEAEIQYLIVLAELHHPAETANNTHYLSHPQSEEEAGRYFLGLRQDWSTAPHALAARGLLQPGPAGWTLTRSGQDVAFGLRTRRPPIYYWYRQFYPAAARSRAYAEFCTRVYGIDLTQAGFCHQAELDALEAAAALRPGDTALDVGCGLGRIAEYLSDRSGAHVHGVDYCPEALDLARLRTEKKAARLSFGPGEMDSLDFAPASFDAVIAIDSLYMPANLEAALARLLGMLKPGGRFAAFYTHFVGGSQEAAGLHAGVTPLGLALQRLGRPHTSTDFSAAAWNLLERKRRTGEAMRPAFEAEGARMLYDFIIAESQPGEEAYHPHTCPLGRYLYVVQV